MNIKIECACGQRYAFAVHPVDGRMPSPVLCPACGADGTEAANAVIAQRLCNQPSSAFAPEAGLRISPAPPFPVPPRTPAVSSTPRRTPATKTKLTWFEQLWIAAPLILIAVGGAVGGGLGGAAWVINRQVFRRAHSPALRYFWTGLISMAAAVAYLVIAGFAASLLRRAK